MPLRPGAGAQACNPSYSGGRDQDDHGSNPAGANSSQDPTLKKPNTKRAGRVAKGEGPRAQAPVSQKKKPFNRWIACC
jgi:hypothetical protein